MQALEHYNVFTILNRVVRNAQEDPDEAGTIEALH